MRLKPLRRIGGAATRLVAPRGRDVGVHRLPMILLVVLLLLGLASGPAAAQGDAGYDRDLPFEASEEDAEPPEEAAGPTGDGETWGVIFAILGVAVGGLLLLHVFPGARRARSGDAERPPRRRSGQKP